ncbi:class I SAM-dependent methyltransferase [Nonomuraea sp. SBT364]|uniref:class I SAM-dependent methyltransferase n=1 Tax=Nonomuraea sp. SBT364 TaxID=1580530 RepID=UPI00066D3AE5|nr:class I SAM-dependent methyltransferase [Nonomuraea sp. SBT364]
MLDYDREAASYDATRGGEARAEAAAEAIERLLPESARVVVDVACGTGIVTARLRRAGRRVAGVDRAAGMAAVAGARMPGGVVIGDAARLPFAGGSADAVTLVWLLHLLDHDTSAAVLAGAARVLRPGGTLITTVDKTAAVYRAGDERVARARDACVPQASDALDRVLAVGAGHGLAMAGRTTFAGLGQGRSPRAWAEILGGPDAGWTRHADPAVVAGLREHLAGLPDQDLPGPDPIYPLVALVKG